MGRDWPQFEFNEFVCRGRSLASCRPRAWPAGCRLDGEQTNGLAGGALGALWGLFGSPAAEQQSSKAVERTTSRREDENTRRQMQMRAPFACFLSAPFRFCGADRRSRARGPSVCAPAAANARGSRTQRAKCARPAHASCCGTVAASEGGRVRTAVRRQPGDLTRLARGA